MGLKACRVSGANSPQEEKVHAYKQRGLRMNASATLPSISKQAHCSHAQKSKKKKHSSILWVSNEKCSNRDKILKLQQETEETL